MAITKRVNNNSVIWNIDGRRIATVDISVLAPDLAVTISAAGMRSKARNTPFDGWQLRGGVVATLVAGRVVYVNEDAPLQL